MKLQQEENFRTSKTFKCENNYMKHIQRIVEVIHLEIILLLIKHLKQNAKSHAKKFCHLKRDLDRKKCNLGKPSIKKKQQKEGLCPFLLRHPPPLRESDIKSSDIKL